MKKYSLLALFLTMALAQAAAPVYMAWRWEDILRTGQQVFWQTAPVDPYDAFRGRYIDLNFKNASGPTSGNEHFESGQTAYASLEIRDGMAFISGISATEPQGIPYVKVRVNYIDGRTAHISLPFKRYYLSEHIAPAAEAAYRESAGRTGIAAIRLKNGLAVIEELYIGDKTLDEYLRNERQ